MTFESLLETLRNGDLMLPLLGSLAAGVLIGGEREVHGKPAGLRTHTLVCFSSALMTLVALRMADWSETLPPGTQIVSDMSRMPHAILTGIGFLGAGVIFREGASVKGLTSAASLWLTAALGIVFGTGLLELATIGTVIALLVLVFLRIMQRLTPPKPIIRLELAVNADSDFDRARLGTILATQGLRAGTVSIRQDKSTAVRRYMLLASTREAGIDCEKLAKVLEKEKAVLQMSIGLLKNEHR